MKFSVLSSLALLPSVALCSVSSPCPSTSVPFSDLSGGGVACVSFDLAYASAYSHLYDNLPSYDVTNAATLGFHASSVPNVDGLTDGVATVGINASLAAQQASPWAWSVPQTVFNEWVAPYCHVNEARTDWRPLLAPAVSSLFSSTPASSISSAVQTVNANLWSGLLLGRTVVFKSSQTPLIYDPMSTLAYGYASCTGVSVLFADALRSVGVPTRVAGTPAWNGAVENGNHNWIEVWLPKSETGGKDDGSGGDWFFIEAAPAGGGESLENPCDKWFCNPNNFANGTQVFATRWSEGEDSVVYPMAWDLENDQVWGVDRTEVYQSLCNAC
jgi:hypothetical protein